MEFINLTGEKMLVRKPDESGRFNWLTVQPNGTVDLPGEVGPKYGLVPYDGENKNASEKELEDKEALLGKGEDVSSEETTDSTGDQEKDVSDEEVPEEYQTEQALKDYQGILVSIKGVGQKTAEDIVRVYPTFYHLAKAVHQNKALPFKDDIEQAIYKKFNEIN